jgi:hypothetical protein
VQEEVVKKRGLRLLPMILAGVLVCAACSEPIERPEADRIARAQLERYASAEGYAIGRYNRSEVLDREQYWLYVYHYLDPPKHELVVTVDRWGKVDLSRMVEGGDRTPE